MGQTQNLVLKADCYTDCNHSVLVFHPVGPLVSVPYMGLYPAVCFLQWHLTGGKMQAFQPKPGRERLGSETCRELETVREGQRPDVA